MIPWDAQTYCSFNFIRQLIGRHARTKQKQEEPVSVQIMGSENKIKHAQPEVKYKINQNSAKSSPGTMMPHC
jgi:hypothetical protein